jgi:hypothetical protein
VRGGVVVNFSTIFTNGNDGAISHEDTPDGNIVVLRRELSGLESSGHEHFVTCRH